MREKYKAVREKYKAAKENYEAAEVDVEEHYKAVVKKGSCIVEAEN